VTVASEYPYQIEAPPRERLPRHVAIIMDGNGRWAQERGQQRVEGHLQGASTVREIVEEASELGLGYLTLYAFSSENWKRPAAELEFLMALLQQYLVEERPTIMNNNIRFRVIGRRDGLSPEVLQEIDNLSQASEKNTGLTLILAINYGSRGEIVDAMQRIACQVRAGELSPEQITESTIAHALYTNGIPDPDLLIRTANEMRVSNFLLWQISYAEFWVTPIHWPEFTRDHFRQALWDYTKRDRRFGGLKN
jgi:undecaprenyl diphosphate synthase